MNTHTKHIIITTQPKDISVDKVVSIPTNVGDRDWAMRKLLHSIFSDFRKGYEGNVLVKCHDKEEEYIAESYYWEESLALLGNHEEIRKYKHSIDNISDDFWQAVFDCKELLRSSKETPFLHKPQQGYIDELLALCHLNYSRWCNFFNFKEGDYSGVNDLYAICAQTTLMGRTPHWCYSHWENSQILALIEALEPCQRINMYKRFIRTIEELHKMGFEKIRIVPSMAPTGLSWRCFITSKKNTSKKCGAMFSTHFSMEKWGKTVIPTNGFFKWNMMELSPYENALRFIKEYPLIAEEGKGNDSEYSQWFKKVVRECYHFLLPITYEEYWNCLEDKQLRLVGFAYTDKTLPFPPPGEGDGLNY